MVSCRLGELALQGCFPVLIEARELVRWLDLCVLARAPVQPIAKWYTPSRCLYGYRIPVGPH